MDRTDRDAESESEPTIEELLSQARSGDEGAIDAVFRHIQPALDRWAERSRGLARAGIARPSDIAQETALLAFRRLGTFKGSTAGELFTWLRVIFRNHTVQLIRAARRKKREAGGFVSIDSPNAMAEPAQQKSPSQTAAQEEDWRLLLGNIYLLPDEQREALLLCHLKELPVATAAEKMGKSEGAVAGLLQRGLRKLQARMATNGRQDGSEMTETLPASVNEAAAALLLYLRRRDTGERVNASAFVAAHPSCASELATMLHWIERIERIKPAIPEQ